jgi:hypothetical protein
VAAEANHEPNRRRQQPTRRRTRRAQHRGPDI